MNYIGRKAASVPSSHADEIRQLGELFEKKLWHQLSVALEQVLRTIPFFRGNDALELYSDFVVQFESKISSIKLVKIVSIIGDNIGDSSKALSLYNGLLSGKTKLEEEAKLFLEMDVILMNILLQGASYDCNLDTYETTLNTLKPSEPLVYSKFYQTKSTFKKIHGPANEFYSSALMYLVYTPLNEMNPQAAHALAVDMALAAITSKKIYNFGEVLATPILSVLANTKESWLKTIVEQLNVGGVQAVEHLLTEHQVEFASSPLAHTLPTIVQKSQLLALVNLSFERNPHDRIIGFAEISNRCRVTADQVEWLLMKAMSLNLVKGCIDEVRQEISITWILPRVLDIPQLKGVCDQIGTWREKVKNAVFVMENNTTELLA